MLAWKGMFLERPRTPRHPRIACSHQVSVGQPHDTIAGPEGASDIDLVTATAEVGDNGFSSGGFDAEFVGTPLVMEARRGEGLFECQSAVEGPNNSESDLGNDRR